VVATGETRECATARLIAALRDYPILGIRTNIPLLLRILEHPRFQAGDIDTGFLDGEGSALTDTPEIGTPAWVSAAIAEADRSPVASHQSPAGSHQPRDG